MGHGGIPEDALTDPQPDSVLYEHRAFVEAGLTGGYLQFGFAVLDFDDKTIQCEFVSELGVAEPDPPIQLLWHP